MAQRRENMVIENTPIPEIATSSEFGGMHFFEPLLQEVFELLFWTCRQRSLSLLIEHLIEGHIRFCLCFEVALPGFAILQDDLRNPFFASLALWAAKHG